MAPKKKAAEVRVEIAEIQMAELHFNVIGTSPLIMHRFPWKAWQELLLPEPRANRATLEQRLKHDPFNEYRSAFYLNRYKGQTAMFHIPNGAFHGAMGTAALDIPGAKKAQIERLTRITDVQIDLYGVPQIFSAMVRNSDISRTPDVRTRPIFPEWACVVTVRFMKSILTERGIYNLMAASGIIGGIGDWRGEKGGPYGAYRLGSENDKQFKAIIQKQGVKAQKAAYEQPAFFDEDTRDILLWFQTEVKRREMEGMLAENKIPQGLQVVRERGGKRNGSGQVGDTEYVGVEA
jgi:hypothetical protein